MLHNKKVIAVIPARGGSKGVPNKNIKTFNGLPLINWTIFSACESKIIDEIYINSDSEEILDIARKTKKVKPFKRPSELAEDNSLIFDTLKHFCRNVESDILILLNPTSPLRYGNLIDFTLNHFNYNQFDLACTGFYSNHFETGSIKMKNRQQLKKFFYDNGSIYIFNTDYILSNNEFYPNQDKIQKIVTEQIYNYEIDTQLDFILLEALHNHLEKRGGCHVC